MIVGKRGKKLKILTLKIETLLDKKTTFVYCWFNINWMKIDGIKLLVYQKSWYLICYRFYSV